MRRHDETRFANLAETLANRTRVAQMRWRQVNAGEWEGTLSHGYRTVTVGLALHDDDAPRQRRWTLTVRIDRAEAELSTSEPAAKPGHSSKIYRNVEKVLRELERHSSATPGLSALDTI